MNEAFEKWIERILQHGESIQKEPPVQMKLTRNASELLERSYRQCVSSLAGPLLPFRVNVAWDAANVLAQACWSLVGSTVIPWDSGWDSEPQSPVDHLSADLFYRFMPGVYRRLKAHDSESEIVKKIELLLKRWPLSGVLAGLDDEPITPLLFEGYLGLQMLYAERLLHNPRPGWLPKSGATREWVELVFEEHGKLIPNSEIPENSIE